MRLFQAQTLYGDSYSPPPPPHFSADREASRFMPVYLNQFRDGRQRLPTPEKVAVMELSNSFERRRLGKHQQILNDISQRCREQEVSDMSGQLSVKLNLHKLQKLGKEVTFYSTTFMDPRVRKASVFPDVTQPAGKAQKEDSDGSPRQIFEKSYKSFPARRIMRQNSKFDFLKGESSSLPNLAAQAPKSSVSDSHVLRSKYMQRHHVTGHLHQDQYVSPRQDLSPLILPNVENYGNLGNNGPQSERLDRMDTYFSTSRVTLGPRARTQVSLISQKTGNATSAKPGKPADMPSFNHEMSQLQLTSGHSPPPNSVQEVEHPAP